MSKILIDEAAVQLGLEALEGSTDKTLSIRAMKALREALAEQPAPVQEQIGEAGTMPGTSGFTMACFKATDVPVGTKLYTSPPAQRTWVGLEKSDMPDGADPLFDDPKFIAGMVYAANKLMEKNT